MSAQPFPTTREGAPKGEIDPALKGVANSLLIGTLLWFTVGILAWVLL